WSWLGALGEPTAGGGCGTHGDGRNYGLRRRQGKRMDAPALSSPRHVRPSLPELKRSRRQTVRGRESAIGSWTFAPANRAI
ncbi:MAG: hypothetical protein ABFS30_16905, partial [Pseudomonadota bacterium]